MRYEIGNWMSSTCPNTFSQCNENTKIITRILIMYWVTWNKIKIVLHGSKYRPSPIWLDWVVFTSILFAPSSILIMKKHNQESVKLGGPDKDSELNRLSSSSYQNNLEFNSKMKFFPSKSRQMNTIQQQKKKEKSLKIQWFSSKGKFFQNPWLKTCNEKDDLDKSFEKFFNPTRGCLRGV